MAEVNIDPKFVDVGSAKRIVILDEEDFHRLLDVIEAIEARKVLGDQTDKEIDWKTASKGIVENRIAERRAEKGISQRELADRMGVKPSTLSRWERKDANLTLATLRKTAGALKCDIHDLIF